MWKDIDPWIPGNELLGHAILPFMAFPDNESYEIQLPTAFAPWEPSDFNNLGGVVDPYVPFGRVLVSRHEQISGGFLEGMDSYWKEVQVGGYLDTLDELEKRGVAEYSKDNIRFEPLEIDSEQDLVAQQFVRVHQNRVPGSPLGVRFFTRVMLPAKPSDWGMETGGIEHLLFVGSQLISLSGEVVLFRASVAHGDMWRLGIATMTAPHIKNAHYMVLNDIP